MKKMKVALLGNPNSGKTTLFNFLTGSTAKVGNWPGVTIEKKVGIIKNTNFELIDLPGIYSLSPYSPEEEISRKFLFEEKPDVIINIVDATSLERGLYLTTQLLELETKVIVALNMCDLLETSGLSINELALENQLGTNVVKISALKETGIKELISEIEKPNNRLIKNIFDNNIENVISSISFNLNIDTFYKRFVCIKLLEEDLRFKNYFYLIHNNFYNLKNKYNTDIEEVIATQRYNFIDKVFKSCVTTHKIKKTTISDRIDKIILNKWLSFPIFALIMFLIYYLSVGLVGSLTVDFISNLNSQICNFIGNVLASLHLPSWFTSLIVDGILEGVCAVLKFLPQLIILFICISVLETCGYMSRIALLLDNLFKHIGLNGKSIIPFIVGSGCSVPGIMSTRIIENDSERCLTTILTPFIPCSAKLPIIALFSSYFFPVHSGFVAVSLYFLAIIIIILSAYIINKFIFKNSSTGYFLELPDYKFPSIKYIFNDVYDKIKAFIKRAGSIIVLCSIMLWFLLSFSTKLTYGVTLNESILAALGKKISWLFYPILGTNSWEATVCAIQGIIAKEQVVSSMNVINSLLSNTSNSYNLFNASSAFSFFSPASAYAFVVFNLFSAPCFGAISAMKNELGSFRRMFMAIAFQTLLAYILACICFFIGSHINVKQIAFSNLILILWLVLLVFVIIKSNFQCKDPECRYCPYFSNCKKNSL